MWIVPITSCCGEDDVQKKFLLKGKTGKMQIKEFTDPQSADGEKGANFWIKLNIDQTGFYRVKYDDELAAGLENAIKTKKLSLMDKIGKVNTISSPIVFSFSWFMTKATCYCCRHC
jgi:puromycin-sensitive aminopeptidase